MRILLAGATGAIGRPTLQLLRAEGHEVRCLSRRPNDALGSDVFVADALDAAALHGAADGVQVVVSSVGASVGLQLTGRATYSRVDVPANRNLLAEAERAGADRFVYVGVHSSPGYAHTRYVQAHESVSRLLAASALRTTTVRPTGLFTAFEALLGMARRGTVRVIGDGSARSNPVHPADVAACVVSYVADGPEDIAMGGPEVLTRRGMAELVFDVLKRTPRIGSVPTGLVRAVTPLVRLVHPRLGDLIEFAAAVSTHDAVAPAVGTRRLGEYLATLESTPPRG